MKWYEQVDDCSEATIDLEALTRKVLTFQKITSHVEPQFSVECQFLLATHVRICSETHTSIPLRADLSLDYLQEKITPHFERSILFFEDGQLVGVTVSSVKDTSKQEFESLYKTKALYPLVHDVYGKDATPLDQSVFRERPVVYRLDPEYLMGDQIEADELVTYFQQTVCSERG